MKNDELVRQDVINELEREPMLDAASIGVAVSDGIVTLSGNVPTYAQRHVAEKATKRVFGVRGIAEELHVKLSSELARGDADIAKAAANALEWDVTVPNKSIFLKVQDGWLTLDGTCKFGFEKHAAEKAVRNLNGVRGLTNLIRVGPGVVSEDVKAEIERTLKLAAERDADKVRVEARDGVVRLHGTVRSWVEREDAGKAAWLAPGVSEVENYITVGV